MLTSFERMVIDEINNFRANPKSIEHSIEVLKRGLSRLRPGDSFLKEIDVFISQLKSMKPMQKLVINEALCKTAKEEVKNYTLDEDYPCFQDKDKLKGTIPNQYLTENPGLVADSGAEEPSNVVPKILLNRLDKFKHGRSMLTNPNYTQIGIGHEIFEDENYIVVIMANKYQSDEPEVPLPEGDLSELKKAFDCLDRYKDQKLRINEIISIMKDMSFDKTNPDIYDIMCDMVSKGADYVSWNKFASIANARMTDRKTDDGLSTIFSLFIDNPQKETITFDTFKHIATEAGVELSDDELKKILENSTKNGNEITYEEFVEYMKV